ncbi:MAG: glycogen-binding domain-containing protein [Verrucomicrobiia bacterium]
MPKSINHREQRLRVTPVNSKRIEVTFVLELPEAQEVCLYGDFSGWPTAGLRLIRRSQNGRWEKRLMLPPGRYEYKCVVDAEWIHDPHASQNVPNPGGSLNPVLEAPT